MSAILKQKLIDIANGFTKYGLWKGGGSNSLSEMTDVTFTDLQANDVLTYNSIEWVNDNNLQTQINTLNSNLKSKVKTYSSIPDTNDLKNAIAIFCALRNSVDTFSSFQGLIPNMKTKYIDISTGSVVLKDITWSKANGTITGDITSYEVRFICIF